MVHKKKCDWPANKYIFFWQFFLFPFFFSVKGLCCDAGVKVFFAHTHTMTENLPAGHCKFDLINWLVAINGYRSYLEVASVTTGKTYTRVSNCNGLLNKERICARYEGQPPLVDDGEPITYPMPSDEAFVAIQSAGKRYDIIFIDGWHTLEQTRRDIENALNCLNLTGTIVMHDCDPSSLAGVGDQYCKGAWFGNTYRAYIALRYEHQHDLACCVVDTDFGCGIIFRLQSPPPALQGRSRELWHVAWPPNIALPGSNLDDAQWWHAFRANRVALLGLISVDTFYSCTFATTAVLQTRLSDVDRVVEINDKHSAAQKSDVQKSQNKKAPFWSQTERRRVARRRRAKHCFCRKK